MSSQGCSRCHGRFPIERLEAQALEGLGRAYLERGEPQLALERYRESRRSQRNRRTDVGDLLAERRRDGPSSAG